MLLNISQYNLMFVLTEMIFCYNFVTDVLLTINQMVKIINCVTLCFRNTEVTVGIM